MSLLPRSLEIIDAITVFDFFSPIRCYTYWCFQLQWINYTGWQKNQLMFFFQVKISRSNLSIAFKWVNFCKFFNKKKIFMQIALQIYLHSDHIFYVQWIKFYWNRYANCNCCLYLLCYSIAITSRIVVCTRISQLFVTWESYRFRENTIKMYGIEESMCHINWCERKERGKRQVVV